MAHDNCTICGFTLNDMLDACPACDAAGAVIRAGYAHNNYHELLAGQIGNLLMQRDWKRIVSLRSTLPRYA